jgi:hypothetical protein
MYTLPAYYGEGGVVTPEQIDDYCKRLAEAWKKVPELSLFKLISRGNVCRETFFGWMSNSNDDLITAIEKMVEHGK